MALSPTVGLIPAVHHFACEVVPNFATTLKGKKGKEQKNQSDNIDEILATKFPEYRLLVILRADETSIVRTDIPSHDLPQVLPDVLVLDADFHPASFKRDTVKISVADSISMMQVFRCLCEIKFSKRSRSNEPFRPSLPSFFLFLLLFLRLRLLDYRTE